jgi:hypothetical protein
MRPLPCAGRGGLLDYSCGFLPACVTVDEEYIEKETSRIKKRFNEIFSR